MSEPLARTIDGNGPKAGRGRKASAARSAAGVRWVSALFYALFAALGTALLARPALLALRGLGLFAPALPWEVPLGRLALLLLALVALFTLRLFLGLALGSRTRLPERALFLALVAAALGVRGMMGAPAPPADPTPALLSGIRLAAGFLEQGYAASGRYAPDERALAAELAALPRPGFMLRGQSLPLALRVLWQASGPQVAPLLDDRPGTLYLALSADGKRAWLSVLTLESGSVSVLESAGRPLVLQARAGTHSAPGRDPLIPEYPGMRPMGTPAK